MPFELIYLHEGRGLSLGVAGVVVGVVTGLAVVAAPAAGPVIDRFGARTAVVGGGVALAVGYAGLAAAHTAPQALLAATAAGVGNGALVPAQSTLLAALAPSELRPRATAVSRVASTGGLAALFVANAASYLLYALILVATVRRDERPEPLPGGYRLLLRDRPFVHLALINVALIAVGGGVFTWIV